MIKISPSLSNPEIFILQVMKSRDVHQYFTAFHSPCVKLIPESFPGYLPLSWDPAVGHDVGTDLLAPEGKLPRRPTGRVIHDHPLPYPSPPDGHLHASSERKQNTRSPLPGVCNRVVLYRSAVATINTELRQQTGLYLGVYIHRL